jgi:hypothetical protein
MEKGLILSKSAIGFRRPRAGTLQQISGMPHPILGKNSLPFIHSKAGNRMKLPSAKSIFRPLAAFAAVAAFVPAGADIVFDQYASPYLSYRTYVDWSATSTEAGHFNYDLFPTSQHPRGAAVKFFDIGIYTSTQGGVRGGCWDIMTQVANGLNTDTEILGKPTGGVWTRINDDIDGANNRFSHIRLFLEDDIDSRALQNLRVAAYNTNYNNDQFNIYVQLVKGITTEASCFSDATVAAAAMDRHENLFIRRAI